MNELNKKVQVERLLDELGNWLESQEPSSDDYCEYDMWKEQLYAVRQSLSSERSQYVVSRPELEAKEVVDVLFSLECGVRVPHLYKQYKQDQINRLLENMTVEELNTLIEAANKRLKELKA